MEGSLLFYMVVINPAIKQQLKDLRKVPYNSIKKESAVIVELPIGQLKNHDLARALYITNNAFIKLTQKQMAVFDIIKQCQKDIEEVTNDDELTKEELIEKVREIILDRPAVSHPLKPSSDEDKES